MARVRPSPAGLFVVATLAVAAGVGALAHHHERRAPSDSPSVPTDAAGFGFVVRERTGTVALLEATRPFELALANGNVRGVAPSEGARARAFAIAQRELARYPSAFLPAARLAGIVFVDALTENDTPVPSLPNVGGLLLFDPSSAEADLVRSLHHEIFHFFDLADDGRVSPDPAWESLNPGGFRYGSGGRTLRGPWAARPRDDLPGFVSAYATSGSEEDKADTFALAIARPELVRSRIGSDAVVRAKVAELARRIAAFDPACPTRLGFDELLGH